MATRMGFSELGNGDLRINLRGIEAGMTEQFLDRAEVRAVLVQVRGAGVAEEMAAAGLADLCRGVEKGRGKRVKP